MSVCIGDGGGDVNGSDCGVAGDVFKRNLAIAGKGVESQSCTRLDELLGCCERGGGEAGEDGCGS